MGDASGGERDALARSDALVASLRALADQSPVMMAVVNRDLRFTFVNARYAAMFGKQPGDLIGRHPRDVLGEKVFSECGPRMQAVLDGEPQEYELFLPATASGPMTVLVRYAPERDAEGEVIAFLAIITDITRRIEAERDRDHHKALQTHAFKMMPDAVLVCDADMRVVVFNHAAERLMGYKAHELVGRPLRDFAATRPDGRKIPLPDQIREAVAHADTACITGWRVRADGSRFFTRTSIAVIRDNEGAVRNYIFSPRDATADALTEYQSAFKRLVIDGLDLALIAWDDGGVRVFNEAAERLLGRDAAGVIGRAGLVDWLEPEEVNARADALSTELGLRIEPGMDVLEAMPRRTGKDVFEWTFIRRDGSRVPVIFTVTAVTSADGSNVGFMGIATDLTAAVEAQQALHRAEQAYASLVEQMGDLLYEADVRTMATTSIHGAVESLTGYTSEEWRACPSLWLESLDPGDRETVLGRIASDGKDGVDGVCEYRFRRKDGSVVWCLDRYHWRRDASGTITAMVGIVTDISARKAAEQRLAESEERFRSIFDHSPDPSVIVAVDDGRFLDCNRAAERLLRGSREEIVGRSLIDLSAPMQADGRPAAEVAKERMASISERGELSFEWIHRRLDGTPVDVLVSASKAMVDGQPVFIGLWRDIGPQKAAQEALHSERDRLEQLVQERTSALRSALSTAEAASKAKTDFLANMSHEVRSPMAAILGYADLLGSSDATAADRDAASLAIRRNGEHLMEVINDILELSRIEAGKLPVEPAVCSPWHVVQAVTATYRVLAADKGITITVETRGLVPARITTDPRRLRQILMNFLSNAVKFTDAKQKVVVGLSVRDMPRAVCFEVADTGIGMSPAQLEKVFAPFEQADSSTTRRFGGTGLGLSISKGLAAALGGTIEAESAPSQGSTFRVVLPLPADVPLVTGESVMADIESEDSTSIDSALTGRVLLVEDSPDLQRLMTLWLKRAGLDVSVAINGREGVEAAMKETFDVVLMDVQMPEMDGIEATAALRRSGYRRPIIGLSAHAMPHDRERFLGGGMTDYLSKPVELPLLLATLRRHLS